jgi:hypothetical protein
MATIVAGCNLTVRDNWPDVNAARTEMMAAQIRRAQVIAEIERLDIVLRRTRVVDNRIALQAAIDARRAELLNLNALLYRE